MDIYFDKANTISFLKSKDKDEFEDCLRLLKRQLNCFFNFPKSELSSNEFLVALLKLLSQGVSTTNKKFLDTPFPDRPLKTNCYQSFDVNQLSAAYLLEDEKLQELKKKGAVLVGTVGEEIQVINSLFLLNKDYKFDKKLRIAGPELSTWNDLAKFQFPTSDLLILDQYILSDEVSIENNLLPLLEVLSIKAFCRINVIIYTKVNDGHLTFDQIKSKIRNAISGSTNVKCNLTLVRYLDQRGAPSSQAEHDRTILTSYSRYYSGDTFNYWKSDGSKQTKGRELIITSYADKETHNLAKELLKDLQKNIDTLPEEFIEGDKKSNFLNFT